MYRWYCPWKKRGAREKKDALRKRVMKEEREEEGGMKKKGDRRKRGGMCRESERGRKVYGKGTCKWFVGASDEGRGEEERRMMVGAQEGRKRGGVQGICHG